MFKKIISILIVVAGIQPVIVPIAKANEKIKNSFIAGIPIGALVGAGLAVTIHTICEKYNQPELPEVEKTVSSFASPEECKDFMKGIRRFYPILATLSIASATFVANSLSSEIVSEIIRQDENVDSYNKPALDAVAALSATAAGLAIDKYFFTPTLTERIQGKKSTGEMIWGIHNDAIRSSREIFTIYLDANGQPKAKK